VNKPVNIIIIETASVIFEGLSGIIQKSGIPIHLFRAGQITEIERIMPSHKKSIVIMNPSFVQNNFKLFNTLRQDYSNSKWIAIVYAFYDPQIISYFDGVINIFDTPESVIALIRKIIRSDTTKDSISDADVLSERETEVLKLLATGHANKDIAEELHISVNTVITHRKNISQKTGIKSLSGLTIYAVVKKLIALDNITL
jgi:DNA-binding NarL/FixJ family response regulator